MLSCSPLAAAQPHRLLPPRRSPGRAGCRHQALRRTASGPTLARAPAGRRQGGDAGGDAGGGKGRLNFL
jgi:hypothetical protein